MDEIDGWFVPCEEVPKDVDSMTKKKFMTSKERVLQATGCPMISTRSVFGSNSLIKRDLGQVHI